MLDEYEKSGLSAKKFALLVGMKHQTFATWAIKRRKQRGVICAQGSQVQRPREAVPKLQWLKAVIEKDAVATGQRREVLSVHFTREVRE